MDKKEFKEILEKNNQCLIEEVDKKIKDNNVMLIEKMDKKFKEIDNRFDQIEQRRIDDNFYFEHKYWDKISIIFDKLQLNDDLKKLDDEKNKKLEQRVERNSAQLMLHGNRISKLEKVVNSK